MSDKVYLTRDGYEKLREELEHLKGPSRKEITQEIKAAREQGDLKENAEYDAAKEKQGRMEARIAEIGGRLSRAVILDRNTTKSDEVCVGSTVVLKNLDDDIKVTYTLVDVSEADFASGKISLQSPVAQGLLGHKAGEDVVINVPARVLKYKIISIS